LKFKYYLHLLTDNSRLRLTFQCDRAHATHMIILMITTIIIEKYRELLHIPIRKLKRFTQNLGWSFS